MGRILKLIHRIFTRLRHLEEKQVSAQDQISAMLQKIQVTQTNHFVRGYGNTPRAPLWLTHTS